ncbi:MAG: BrnT family toxin [Planctomycetes bacterium]|nr:BrnT family toxin [Planctomycetota bacterium]
MSLQFEWDEDRDASIQKKHKVTFEEATTVFADPLAAIFDDEVHSEDEQREIIVGHSVKNRLLLVCFTERAEAIRIISARLATKKERRDYEGRPQD